jgi:hypothetical protein
LKKVQKAGGGTTRNDSIALCREQHAELYAGDGTVRLIADHPSNARLIGTYPQADLVRATALTVAPEDAKAVVYVARGGAALRVATATAVRRKDGTTGLADWRIEPGFEHAATPDGGGLVHRVARVTGAASSSPAEAQR